MELLQRHKPYISILLEEVGETHIEGCARYILEAASQGSGEALG